jgi:hypothetical protein
MAISRLAVVTLLLSLAVGNPLPVNSVERDAAGEDPYNYYKNPRIFESTLCVFDCKHKSCANATEEKRDSAGEDPYNYYKNPRIFESRL